MNTNVLVRFTQQQIEKLVFDFISESHPEFKLKEAFMETDIEGNEVKSWWVVCDHQQGNESIMEDEQILELIQHKLRWGSIIEVSASETKEGFLLELRGK